MNITLSQDSFYNLNVNENMGLVDIIKYYFYLIGYVGISSSCIYFIMKINDFVDGFFEYTETDDSYVMFMEYCNDADYLDNKIINCKTEISDE